VSAEKQVKCPPHYSHCSTDFLRILQTESVLAAVAAAASAADSAAAASAADSAAGGGAASNVDAGQVGDEELRDGQVVA
jgi:hypothetical protein